MSPAAPRGDVDDGRDSRYRLPGLTPACRPLRRLRIEARGGTSHEPLVGAGALVALVFVLGLLQGTRAALGRHAARELRRQLEAQSAPVPGARSRRAARALLPARRARTRCARCCACGRAAGIRPSDTPRPSRLLADARGVAEPARAWGSQLPGCASPGMITLHHVPFSRSLRVRWLLEELGPALRARDALASRELKRPEHLALHPLGKVPVLRRRRRRAVRVGRDPPAPARALRRGTARAEARHAASARSTGSGSTTPRRA